MKERFVFFLSAFPAFVFGYFLCLFNSHDFTWKDELDPIAILGLLIPVFIGLFITIYLQRKSDASKIEIELLSKEILIVNNLLSDLSKEIGLKQCSLSEVSSLLKQIDLQLAKIQRINIAFRITIDSEGFEHLYNLYFNLAEWSTLSRARMDSGVIVSDGHNPLIIKNNTITYNSRRKTAIIRKITEMSEAVYKQLVHIANS